MHKVTYCENCIRLVPQNQITTHKIVCENRNRPKDFKCHICTVQSRYKKSIEQHIKKFHGKESIQCQNCQKYCSSSDKFQRHLKSHLGFACSVCGEYFKTKYGKKRHEMENHAENDKESETFLQIYNDISSSKPSSTKRKVLHCKFCNYQTHSKKLFKRHVERLHLAKRTPALYKCEFCPDFSSKYKKSINYHKENTCSGLAEQFNVIWFDD